mmetsp:Transcript_39147/g.90401  ORF Transcript_39147/g.90401 Transcript_39147/m.90401 type:complete len:121 (+) Transcript_39147:88-450(+)
MDAWCISMLMPAASLVVKGTCMELLCWDTPLAERFDTNVTGETQGTSWFDHNEVLMSPRVLSMFGHRAGHEQHHFRTYSQRRFEASALACSLGLMNLVACSQCSRRGTTNSFCRWLRACA